MLSCRAAPVARSLRPQLLTAGIEGTRPLHPLVPHRRFKPGDRTPRPSWRRCFHVDSADDITKFIRDGYQERPQAKPQDEPPSTIAELQEHSDTLQSQEFNPGKLQRIVRDGDRMLMWFSNRVRPKTISPAWLRDMCPCPSCRDPDSGQRKFPSTAVSPFPKSRDITVDAAGSLSIRWGPGAPHGDKVHNSTWTPEQIETWWSVPILTEPSPAPALQPIKWLRSSLEELLPHCRITFREWIERGPAFWNALYFLRGTGLAFVTDVPASHASVAQIASQVGRLQETFYGRTWDVVSKPHAENVAYTSEFLDLHQDLLYLPNTPRLQFLHCLSNSCEGGDSLFSDGLRAGQAAHDQLDARQIHALSSILPTYHYDKNGNTYSRARPVIEYTEAYRGNVARVNWSPPFQGPFPPGTSTKAMARWKYAARKFQEEISLPEAVYKYKLKAGECVVMDNHRIMHGRREFNTLTGYRHLKGCYVSDETFRDMEHELLLKVSRDPTAFNIKPMVRAQENAAILQGQQEEVQADKADAWWQILDEDEGVNGEERKRWRRVPGPRQGIGYVKEKTKETSAKAIVEGEMTEKIEEEAKAGGQGKSLFGFRVPW